MSAYTPPKRTYAVRVQTIDQHQTQRIVVSVMAREDDSPHPINCKSDGETVHEGATKKTAGLQLDGLVLRAYRSSDAHNDGRYRVYDFELSYVDVWSANRFKVKRMAKTIDKVAKTMDGAGGSPELQLQAFCAALGVTHTVTRTTDHHSSSYSDSKWQFSPGVSLAAVQLREHITALEHGSKEKVAA